ncbi:MAG TPA: hypothetical protein VNZ64_27905 [Candidatus Acidoferrum sp.]|nr:hypothetical protein [Candidatus Acidoferrum sp.]
MKQKISKHIRSSSIKESRVDSIRSKRIDKRTYRLPPGLGVVPSTGKASAAIGSKLNTYGDAPPGTTFANSGGPVIGNVDVQLVFWGREWGRTPPVSPSAIQQAVNDILRGPYMSRLTQYGCSGKGRVRGTTFVTNSDPPNPFNDANVQQFVIGLIDSGTLPEPDEDWGLFVCVFMPTYANYGPGGASGAHSAVVWSDYDLFDVDNDWAHVAWIGNPGSIDPITTTFSHELVEACTDPQTTGSPAWRQTPCNTPNQCEIGDVCNSTARVNGVQVQAYWSQIDNSCVIPAGGWFQIHPETVFDHTTQQIATVARTNNHVDLFVIGFDNAVWSTWWEPGPGWSPWFQIHPETVFDHTTQRIATVARTQNHVDLFVIGFDNAVWSTWWEQGPGWSPWFQIHPETVFDHTTQQIATVARTNDHVDLFVIGFDNAVWSTWWEAGPGWSPWFQIHPETVFDHTTQQIATVARTNDHVDLFVIGFDNAVWSTWWEDAWQ